MTDLTQALERIEYDEGVQRRKVKNRRRAHIRSLAGVYR